MASKRPRRGRRGRQKSRSRRQEPREKPQRIDAEDVVGRLERALSRSPADETELVWLDAERGSAESREHSSETPPSRQTTLFVRVLERGRLGEFRRGTMANGEIESAIRLAIAQSRSRQTLQGLPHLPANDPEPTVPANLYDEEVATLGPEKARRLLERELEGREEARLDWGSTELVVVNNRGLRRQARTSHVTVRARCGRAPGAGRAAASSRTLADLDLDALMHRARRRHGRGAAGELPTDKTTLVLAQEATIRLLDLLNNTAFTASSYHQGTSFLREHLGVQVFDRRLSLRDDATDESGLPFPFDFEGTAKRPVDLIVKGAPKTPALDQRQAALLGLPPTGHAVAGNDAVAQNLFLLPGEDSHQKLLEEAADGVCIGWLDHVECFDPLRVRFRARARGARRIENGALGRPLPDLIWEDSLLRALSNVSGLGAEMVTWSLGTFVGGITAPALSLAEVVGLKPDLPL